MPKRAFIMVVDDFDNDVLERHIKTIMQMCNWNNNKKN